MVTRVFHKATSCHEDSLWTRRQQQDNLPLSSLHLPDHSNIFPWQSPGRPWVSPISSPALATEVSLSCPGRLGSGQGVMPVPTCLLSWQLGLQQSQPRASISASCLTFTVINVCIYLTC